MYNISEEFIKKKKNNSILVLLIIPIIIISVLLTINKSHSLNLNLITVFFYFIILNVFCLLIIFIYSKFILKDINNTSLTIDNFQLIRFSGNHKEKFNLKDLILIKTYYLKNNELLGIKLLFNKKSVDVFGFEKLDDILENISLSEIKIIRKNVKFNASNPLSIVIAMILPVIVILIMTFADLQLQSIFNYFKVLIFFLTALFLIISKPISKARGIKYRKFDIILGILWIIISFSVFYIDCIEPTLK